MKFEIRVLLLNEDTFVIETDDLVKVDQMIPVLGKLSKVSALTVVALPDSFSAGKEFLLEQICFKFEGES